MRWVMVSDRVKPVRVAENEQLGSVRFCEDSR